MSHATIRKKFPGKRADEIYERVDEVMHHLAEKLSLHYEKDMMNLSGKVSKMGVHGTYVVRNDEVTIDLKYPMLVPGHMRQRVQEDIERKLDALFS